MPETAPTDSPSARASARTRKLLACSPTSCFSFDMEILSFGIDLAPQDKKVPRLRGRPSDQSPAARLPRHDREHFSTIVNTAPRMAPKCSRSRETLFTLPWNPCSPSRGNPIHDRVEYARLRRSRRSAPSISRKTTRSSSSSLRSRATPTLFDPNNPPSIVTTLRAVEDWTIENRTLKHHEFHTHQNHFLVLRMDCRGLDVGDFVYHCHIAEHGDHGMMAIIRVNPAPAAAKSQPEATVRPAGQAGPATAGVRKPPSWPSVRPQAAREHKNTT